jgi:hypothetical protein
MFIFRPFTGRDKIIDLGIQSCSAMLHKNGNVAIRVPGLYHLYNLVRRVISVLQGKNNLIATIILSAETGKIVKKIVIKPFEGLDDRNGGKSVGSRY